MFHVCGTNSDILGDSYVAGSSPTRLSYRVLIRAPDAYTSEVAQLGEHEKVVMSCDPYSNIIPMVNGVVVGSSPTLTL